MIGKLICWWTGKHRRGKFLRVDHGSEQFNVYACPRCSRETRYKVRAKSADVLQIPSAKREST